MSSSPSPSTTIRRQLITLAIVALLFSTLFVEINLSSGDKLKKKKKKLMKYLAAGIMLAQQMKPKKSIKPVPIPIPIPLPIEWEQPPIVIHQKHKYDGY